MIIGVPKEVAPGERRVALVPETVKKLAAKKHSVVVAEGAGLGSAIDDAEYIAAGATIVAASEVAKADVVVRVAAPSLEEIGALREGSALIALLYPLARPEVASALATRRITALALDMIPRTTLAQAMDVLSSQASFAGYWAVVAAASRLPKIFPLQMTAAGTVTPSRVLVMGAGVAGLQAIGTAKRLGGVVEASDVRPETKEQVESLGAKFLVVQGVAAQAGSGGYAAAQSEEYLAKQRELIADAIKRADVVITTALIPGRKAPVLVTDEHVRSMRRGSVVVDLAAEQGGNVVGSEPGREVVRHGVTIIGAQSAASNVASHASQAFSRNLEKLFAHVTDDGVWKLDVTDEITRSALITQDGSVVHAGVKAALDKLAAPIAQTGGTA